MAATTDPAHDADPEPVSVEYSRVMTEWLTRTLGSAGPERARPR
jgi:hypothetical protein